MNWYLDVLKKYAEFGGRARRKEYWYFVLFNILISILTRHHRCCDRVFQPGSWSWAFQWSLCLSYLDPLVSQFQYAGSTIVEKADGGF